MRRILCLLQNAWALDEDQARKFQENTRYWEYALWVSRSGRRLRLVFNEELRKDLLVRNASPRIAIGNSRGRFPYDRDHVRAILTEYQPGLVVACGAEASLVQNDWDGNLILLPHPAHRTAPNAIFTKAAELLGQDRIRVRLQPEYIRNRLVIDTIAVARPGGAR